jgi:hypothetical protein
MDKEFKYQSRSSIPRLLKYRRTFSGPSKEITVSPEVSDMITLKKWDNRKKNEQLLKKGESGNLTTLQRHRRNVRAY